MAELTQIQIMRIQILGNKSDESKDEIFQIKLNEAKDIIFHRVYPFNKTITAVPDSLRGWQTRCAIELYNRLTSGVVSSYSENGISYSYKTDGISESLLLELPPAQIGVIE